MGFVQNHQIPLDGLDVIGLGLGELVRADDGACCALERVAAVLLAKGVVALGLQQNTLQVELVLQFLVPLLAQVGGHDDQDATAALSPALGDHQPRLDGLAEPHFVGQDDAAR